MDLLPDAVLRGLRAYGGDVPHSAVRHLQGCGVTAEAEAGEKCHLDLAAERRELRFYSINEIVRFNCRFIFSLS